MNEEIEYAEMLEIPVSTVNVVKKKRGRKSKQNAGDLKESVIEKVNGKLDEPASITAEAELFAESANSEGNIDFDDGVERVDTVRLYAEGENRFLDNENENFDGGRYASNAKKDRVARIVLGVEFAAACALCGAIFLTNIFMPGSAINTFFRALDNPKEATQTDERKYSDFTLTNVVSDYSDTELNLSEAGILSFTDECHVYPVADGKVSEVEKDENGVYTLKIAHSDSFTGVISGLDVVYYAVGDTVKANIPVGFTDGESEVQVTMYSAGELLNCFEITDENCLAWVEQS
ncbi:MAG: hypothetical protein IJX88_00895 [Clostridia bacterium]|nr:hypothetical protein [Clostridia bacterium]